MFWKGDFFNRVILIACSQLGKVYNIDMSESEKRSLEPPMGNLTIIFIEELEDKSLQINWMNSIYMPTIIHPEGEESDMYEFLKKKFKTKRESAGASIAIISDNEGKPLEIGERGGHGWVKRKNTE